MISEQLNANCFCISLDEAKLRQSLERELGSPELLALIEERCPHLFSARPVFMSTHQCAQMRDVVRAVESVVSLPAYRDFVLRNAPAIARHDPGGAKGVFFGYDFHLQHEGCGIIEINTNAGGAMLNAVLARAHHACCLDDERIVMQEEMAMQFEESIVAMFRSEWKLSRGMQQLKTIAIVDTSPRNQYLYPEFLLFQALFSRHGLDSIIADPTELHMHEGRLMHGATVVDMVYNRLTDFMLEEADSASIRAAYQANVAVVTPHPQAHALYANKRNLAVLCDDRQMQDFGVPHEVRAILAQHLLATEIVDAGNAERLWQNRRHLFFKPAAGYGGKAAYRGEKLTKRVWQEILAGDYIAQALMLPSTRVAGSNTSPETLKFDIRCYAYDGTVQWTAARLYQGQTTNFRTPGGGFAPAYSVASTIGDEGSAGLHALGAAEVAACCKSNCI